MIENFESFLIAIIILTLTPGLDTALVIRNTTRGGFADGCITSVGVCSGLFVHAILSAVGVSAILAQSAELFNLVKMVGAAYLIYLGITSLRSVLHSSAPMRIQGSEAAPVQVFRSLREGFLSNVLNPKTAVFYLAFLPQFMNPEQSPLLQSLLMAGTHFVIAMIWQCSLAGALNKAKKLLNSARFMRYMEATTGVVLIALGVKLLLDKAP